MKKLTVKLFGLVAVIAAMNLTSCSSDDPAPIVPGEDQVIIDLEAGTMKGTLDEDYTLDASVNYNLTGQFIIAEGATLNIPAGTKILANEGGTDVYLAVLKGGKININGTASNPVIMSSLNGEPGDWGWINYLWKCYNYSWCRCNC